LKIGFIGAGKVGFTLGKYFSDKGIKLSGYSSKSKKSSMNASIFTNSKNYINIEDLINESDFIFITTPDDEILNVWKRIRSFNLENKIICHTSGSLSSKIFSDANNSGPSRYSIHPMFPFSDKYTSYKKLNNACFSIEGDEKYLDKIISFFHSLGNKAYIIDGNKKSLYHLANVTVSNLVLSLLETGTNYLIECGFNSDDAINALMPLIKSNINSIYEKGFVNSLTGPIERNDLGTIKHHMEVMPQKDIDLYKSLSLNLLNLSEMKHKDKDYSSLKKYLGILK
jgi:predicted short-subunit dehydrogenase-like oxidoreductase (DUF2520 family)